MDATYVCWTFCLMLAAGVPVGGALALRFAAKRLYIQQWAMRAVASAHYLAVVKPPTSVNWAPMMAARSGWRSILREVPVVGRAQTVIIATHDERIARTADRVVHLADGQIA